MITALTWKAMSLENESRNTTPKARTANAMPLDEDAQYPQHPSRHTTAFACAFRAAQPLKKVKDGLQRRLDERPRVLERVAQSLDAVHENAEVVTEPINKALDRT